MLQHALISRAPVGFIDIFVRSGVDPPNAKNDPFSSNFAAFASELFVVQQDEVYFELKSLICALYLDALVHRRAPVETDRTETILQ